MYKPFMSEGMERGNGLSHYVLLKMPHLIECSERWFNQKMKRFCEIKEKVCTGQRKTIAVAAAADLPVLMAVRDAVNGGLANAVLVGAKEDIEKKMKQAGLGHEHIEIIAAANPAAAVGEAVQLVRSQKAHILMKGMVSTAVFMRAVLSKEEGLNIGNELTHISVFEVPKIHRLILMTDPAMHMYPELKEKVKMLQAAVKVCRALEIEDPKAAAVYAVEVVNPAMPPTIDAAALAQMSNRGQIPGITVDGPLALDAALSPEAAAHKKLHNSVAGQADVLLMPNIETGNVMWKTLAYMGEAKIAGVITGASAPIVLTSRSDSPDTKLNSIALALLLALS